MGRQHPSLVKNIKGQVVPKNAIEKLTTNYFFKYTLMWQKKGMKSIQTF